MKDKFAIGKKIKALREWNMMTQRELGLAIGLPEATAGIRIAQYESGIRGLSYIRLCKVAGALGVPVAALRERGIHDHLDVIHSLFGLEDDYGLMPVKAHAMDGDPIYALMFSSGELQHAIKEWQSKRLDHMHGLCSEDEYKHWKAAYPKTAGANTRY